MSSPDNIIVLLRKRWQDWQSCCGNAAGLVSSQDVLALCRYDHAFGRQHYHAVRLKSLTSFAVPQIPSVLAIDVKSSFSPQSTSRPSVAKMISTPVTRGGHTKKDPWHKLLLRALKSISTQKYTCTAHFRGHQGPEMCPWRYERDLD